MMHTTRWNGLAVLLLSLALLPVACGDHDHGDEGDHDHGDSADHGAGDDHGHGHGEDEGESWAVTAWGEHYEIFPEIDPLIVGTVARAHTHVTLLEDFSPMTAGTVEIVLRGSAGDTVFRATEPIRPGIFNVEIQPERVGEYDLVFRIEPAGSTAGSTTASIAGPVEEIPGGRVRVGTVEDPGGLLTPPSGGGEEEGEVSFLKEQQWRTPFATAWVASGTLHRAATGVAHLRPPAGGEAHLAAPQAGLVLARPWPYPGQRVAAGAALLRLVPQVAMEQSLATLEGTVSTLEGELSTHQARRARLEELLALEAVSLRQVEEARLRQATLETRLDTARRDLAATQAVREGRGEAEALTVRAPFAGEVAAVEASPGQAVEAGAPLVQVVRTDRVWLEVALPPADARRVAEGGIRGVTVDLPEGESLTFTTDAGARLVSVAPRMDASGTVAVRVEVPPSAALLPGATVTAQVHLAETVEGIVVPTTALVDDSGVMVVYLQDSGEGFSRHEVQVPLRQGDRALIAALPLGQRIVIRGGDAIRRATLLAGGQNEGHVH
jgi:membrane fusion protein, heavy metal efflux system